VYDDVADAAGADNQNLAQFYAPFLPELFLVYFPESITRFFRESRG
jgi:hypothetical protein